MSPQGWQLRPDLFCAFGPAGMAQRIWPHTNISCGLAENALKIRVVSTEDAWMGSALYELWVAAAPPQSFITSIWHTCTYGTPSRLGDSRRYEKMPQLEIPAEEGVIEELIYDLGSIPGPPLHPRLASWKVLNPGMQILGGVRMNVTLILQAINALQANDELVITSPSSFRMENGTAGSCGWRGVNEGISKQKWARLKTMGLANGCGSSFTFIAFLSVGTSCGWFVVNSLYNLVANEPKIAQGGAMIGLINQVGAIAGLILCSMFGVYPIFCGKLSKRMEVWGSSILIVLSLLSLVLLAIIWDAPAVVNLCSVFGSIVGHGSILLLFPLIAINYSGWLVAPVRSGTDLSSMISAFLAEAQTSDGVNQRFPTWLLFTLYSIISCCGLVAWTVILKYGIGLRAHATDEELGGTPRGAFVRERLAIGLQSLFCPKPLVAPVAMAALTQITQWSIAANLGEIGAEMCDPLECGGTEGRFVFRLSLTLSQILVPLGSLVSSVGARVKVSTERAGFDACDETGRLLPASQGDAWIY
eukprot:g15398.t1